MGLQEEWGQEYDWRVKTFTRTVLRGLKQKEGQVTKFDYEMRKNERTNKQTNKQIARIGDKNQEDIWRYSLKDIEEIPKAKDGRKYWRMKLEREVRYRDLEFRLTRKNEMKRNQH